MKKRIAVIAILLVMAMILTACKGGFVISGTNSKLTIKIEEAKIVHRNKDLALLHQELEAMGEDEDIEFIDEEDIEDIEDLDDFEYEDL